MESKKPIILLIDCSTKTTTTQKVIPLVCVRKRIVPPHRRSPLLAGNEQTNVQLVLFFDVFADNDLLL